MLHRGFLFEIATQVKRWQMRALLARKINAGFSCVSESPLGRRRRKYQTYFRRRHSSAKEYFFNYFSIVEWDFHGVNSSRLGDSAASSLATITKPLAANNLYSLSLSLLLSVFVTTWSDINSPRLISGNLKKTAENTAKTYRDETNINTGIPRLLSTATMYEWSEVFSLSLCAWKSISHIKYRNTLASLFLGNS